MSQIIKAPAPGKFAYIIVQYPIGTTVFLAPMTITFNAILVGGTPPYTYSWNFGDNTTSNQAAPIHYYALPGSYAITLTVLDSQNSKITAGYSLNLLSTSGITTTGASIYDSIFNSDSIIITTGYPQTDYPLLNNIEAVIFGLNLYIEDFNKNNESEPNLIIGGNTYNADENKNNRGEALSITNH
jgi:hypothetical protein